MHDPIVPIVIKLKHFLSRTDDMVSLLTGRVGKYMSNTGIFQANYSFFQKFPEPQTGCVECGFHEDVKCHQQGIRVFIVYR